MCRYCPGDLWSLSLVHRSLHSVEELINHELQSRRAEMARTVPGVEFEALDELDRTSSPPPPRMYLWACFVVRRCQCFVMNLRFCMQVCKQRHEPPIQMVTVLSLTRVWQRKWELEYLSSRNA